MAPASSKMVATAGPADASLVTQHLCICISAKRHINRYFFPLCKILQFSWLKYMDLKVSKSTDKQNTTSVVEKKLKEPYKPLVV